MDLISIESQQEMNNLGGVMNQGNVREVWTSGRYGYIYKDKLATA